MVVGATARDVPGSLTVLGQPGSFTVVAPNVVYLEADYHVTASDPAKSFIASVGGRYDLAIDQKGRMVASIRNWPILINERWPAVLLGPLAIAPELRGLGYGKALMWHAMAQARMQGHSRIILVGDPEYYNQFGFRRDLALNIQLPGWVEERRFLALELVAGAMIGVHGMIGKSQKKPRRAARRR